MISKADFTGFTFAPAVVTTGAHLTGGTVRAAFGGVKGEEDLRLEA